MVRSASKFRTKKGQFSANHYALPWFEIGFQIAEPLDPTMLKAIWAEFVCTMLFIYIATGVVVFGCHSSDTGVSATSQSGATAQPEDCFLNQTRVLTIATGFGMSIFVLVYVAAGFSGGHLNPAVTLAFMLSKKISVMRAVLYWAVQLGGAIAGSALVYATDKVGYKAAGGAANRLLETFPSTAGWLMECILTFALVFVVFASTDTHRAQSTAHLPILAPMAIGFVVFADHLAAVAIDGCSVNPARSFGPAVISGNWTHMWVFFAGPLSGAAIAAGVYELTFRPSREPLLPIDHVAKRGQHAQPSKLPGYSGVAGLFSSMEDDDHNTMYPGTSPMHGAKGDGNARSRRDTANQELLEGSPTSTGNYHTGNYADQHDDCPVHSDILPNHGGGRSAGPTSAGNDVNGANGIVPGKTDGRGRQVI